MSSGMATLQELLKSFVCPYRILEDVEYEKTAAFMVRSMTSCAWSRSKLDFRLVHSLLERFRLSNSGLTQGG
jgi:hypothetical protein